MERFDAKIIIAYAQSNMKKNIAASKVYCSPGSITNHFRIIRKETGLDPENFFDLGELYTIARGKLGDDFELL
jgi:hypothetical protein